MAEWQPFFIVGSGRSGTTMLRRLLNHHSQVCVPGETHFIPDKLDPFCRLLKQGRPGEAVALLNQLPLIQRWEVQLEIQDIKGLDGEAAYARAIDLLMTRRAARDGKPFWGEKTPSYVFEVPLLRRLFPKARFIHVHRDGRDVALSIMPLKWGPNNAYSAARWWRHAIETWWDVQPHLGEDALDICYREFVEAPEAGLRRICDFLGLTYEAGMLERYTISRDRYGNWRNPFYMSQRERQAFEYAAGDVLETLGYERSIDHPHWSLWLRTFSVIDNVFKAASNKILRQGI